MWKGKTRGGVSGYLFFIYLIRHWGIKATYGFLPLVVPYFIPFAPKATRSIWQYTRCILKRNSIHSAIFLLKNYYRLGQVLVDKVAIGNGMMDNYHFKFSRYQEFLNLLDSGQGAIIIGAHVGNWEIGTPFFNDYAKKMNVVMYDAEYQNIKEILKKNGQRQPYKIIPVNEDSLAHIFKIAEALDNKEYVCFQGDRYLNADKLLTCKFMGQEASFPVGPFLLAAQMKVPTVFYFAMREARQTYHFHFIPAEETVRAKGKRTEQLLLEQYVNALENILEQYPEQWFNYYPFWKLPNKKRTTV